MRYLSLLVVFSWLVSGAWAQSDGTKSSAEKKVAAKRLAFMKENAQAFKGFRSKDNGKITPIDKPLLRWTNPYSNVKDGLLVGWVDEKGVPMAMAQIFLFPGSDSIWGIEVQSLSQDAFSLASPKRGLFWRPSKPGVRWAAFPGKAMKPSASKKIRLAQMRNLARRFRGDDNFENAEDESALRLLPDPMVRYADPERGTIDGAVFALVHGTDPEMIILVESRKEKDQDPKYMYALARMTGYELHGYLDKEEVWTAPAGPPNRVTDVFWRAGLGETQF